MPWSVEKSAGLFTAESCTVNSCALERRICNGDEGGKLAWSVLLISRKPPICLDDADRGLRVGVARIEENNGFLGCKLSRDGRETDCGTTDMLDEGAICSSGTPSYPGNS